MIYVTARAGRRRRLALQSPTNQPTNRLRLAVGRSVLCVLVAGALLSHARARLDLIVFKASVCYACSPPPPHFLRMLVGLVAVRRTTTTATTTSTTHTSNVYQVVVVFVFDG